jgi:20S proteasome alpha/beta subunit
MRRYSRQSNFTTYGVAGLAADAVVVPITRKELLFFHRESTHTLYNMIATIKYSNFSTPLLSDCLINYFFLRSCASALTR